MKEIVSWIFILVGGQPQAIWPSWSQWAGIVLLPGPAAVLPFVLSGNHTESGLNITLMSRLRTVGGPGILAQS